MGANILGEMGKTKDLRLAHRYQPIRLVTAWNTAKRVSERQAPKSGSREGGKTLYFSTSGRAPPTPLQGGGNGEEEGI